ncbi:glycosyl transferase [Bryobacterales bacterium F-183]|nr:glycosyl transferase [Bryobacterales bacterium F-183]
MIWVSGALLLGSWVYCILMILAVRKWVSVRPSPLRLPPEGISILKPLAGLDDGLEANLRTFFTQDYRGPWEILFAVRMESDAAVPVVRKLQGEFPNVPSRLLIVGEPPYPNAKVWSLDRMMREASHDLLIMSDSDMRVDNPHMLTVIAAEFQDDSNLGVATCPYRAYAGASIWSRLEAMGMNTEFFGGVFVARMLEGVRFAIGPTIAARRRCLGAIGGFDKISEYLAEDFVMGKFAAEAGWNVILSSYVVEHHIGSEDFQKNAAHRIRWNRSTRRSRPAGYIGQIFTNPVPLGLLFAAVAPKVWIALLFTLSLRVLSGKAVSEVALRTRPLVDVPLLVAQDLLSFAFWLSGFFGNTIVWRGIRYKLESDGKFTRI